MAKYMLNYCAKNRTNEDKSTPPDLLSNWKHAIATFEAHIKDRDLVLIKNKIEIRKYQSLFRKIYLQVILSLTKQNSF
jgi:hypothetical protein